MTTVRTAAVPALLLVAAAALAACGATGDRPAAPAGPSMSNPPAGPGKTPSAPSRPPKTPTDLVGDDGSVVGTVTRGGSGPCYGLVTDDGTEYALYNADGLALTHGTRVRVHVGPPSRQVDCGTGRPRQLRSAEPL